MLIMGQGELDPIYTAGEYAEGAREALEKEGKLGSYLVVEGALHYLSWGCWADVNKKLVEVMKKEVKEAKELEQEEEQAGVEEGVIDV